MISSINIIKELVDLKNIKDKFGKTPEYLERQPKAWKDAKEYLKSGIYTSYKDFIFNNLIIPNRVNLMSRIETRGGKFETFHLKMGLSSHIDVEITHLNTYSRSFEFEVKFDKYTEVFLFYINDNVGPSALFNEFNNKLYKVVNSTISKNERWDILDKANAKAKSDFAKKLNKSNFKTIK